MRMPYRTNERTSGTPGRLRRAVVIGLSAVALDQMLTACNTPSGEPYPAQSGETAQYEKYTKVYTDPGMNDECGDLIDDMPEPVPVLRHQAVNIGASQVEANEVRRDLLPLLPSQCEGLTTVWIKGEVLGPVPGVRF